MAKLTLEEREAIRKYMVRVVFIPGIFVTVIAGVIGYLFSEIQEVSTTKAYQEAYSTAAETIFNTTAAAKDAVANAKYSQREAEDLLREVRLMRDRLETLSGLAETDVGVDEIATNIANRHDFRKNILDTFPMPSYDSGWFDLQQNCQVHDYDIGFVGLPALATAYYKITEGSIDFIFPWGLNQYGDSHQTNGVLLDFDERGKVYIRLPCGSKSGNNVLHLGTYASRSGTMHQQIDNREDVQFRFKLWKAIDGNGSE